MLANDRQRAGGGAKLGSARPQGLAQLTGRVGEGSGGGLLGIPGPSCRPRLLMGEIDAGRPTLAPEVQGLGRAGNHQGTRLKIQQDSGPARPDPPCTGSGARVGGRMASYCWGLNTSSGAGGRERQRQLGTQGGTPQQGPALAHGWARPAGPRAPQQPVAGENPPPGALECGGGSAQPSPPPCTPPLQLPPS